MYDIDGTIGRIYEAVENPEYWSVVGDDIAELAGGGAVHLMLASLDTGAAYVSEFRYGDPQFALEYLEDFAEIDFRVPRVMARKPGELLDERSYVSPDDVRRSPIHQELLPRYKVHKIVGSNMCMDDCIGWFGISTPDKDSEFDISQTRAFGLLSSHLYRALSLHKDNRDLRLSRDMSRGVLDAADGSLLLFTNGELVHANLKALELLDDGFFVIRHGRLVCANVAENGRLEAYLHGDLHPRRPPLMVRDIACGAVHFVRTHTPLPSYSQGQLKSGIHLAVSIVTVGDTGDPDIEAVAAFCGGYGVSKAEIATVHSVLCSESLRRNAEVRGIALDTVQKHLKSALAKMGLRSQKKLFQMFERFRSFG